MFLKEKAHSCLIVGLTTTNDVFYLTCVFAHKRLGIVCNIETINSNVKGMWMTLGVTSLLENLESMTPNLRAGGAAKTTVYGKSRRPCDILYIHKGVN